MMREVPLKNYYDRSMILYIIKRFLYTFIEEVEMMKISATKLRNNFFDYLDKASAGETIVIQRNKQEVARLVPTHPIDWRDKMSIKPELLVSPEELIQPIEEIWEEYE